MKLIIKLLSVIIFLFIFSSGFSQGEEKKTFLSEKINLTSYVVKKGDTLWTLYEEDWLTVAKLNKISPDALLPGMTLLTPVNMDEASIFSPLPDNLPLREEQLEEKIIYADLKLQVLGKYENGTLIEWHPISSGKKEHPTPRGEFRVNRKDKNHVSNSVPKPDGGAPMPYALRFYGPYWIHEGSLPGHEDSYGCIRLMKMDALTLYYWASVGTKVIVK
jgi:hypothetical protein